MNIGYVLQGYPVKSQTWIPLEIRELERRGHKVDVIDIEKPLNAKVIKNCDFLLCHFSYQGLHAGRWGIPFAVLLSTLLFVMPHAPSFGSAIPITQLIGGILFAVSYEVEKNLLVPITIHCLGNLAIFTLARLT